MTAYVYKNDLLAPYLALPQGEKVQAECTSYLLCRRFPQRANPSQKTFGLTVTAAFAQKPL